MLHPYYSKKDTLTAIVIGGTKKTHRTVRFQILLHVPGRLPGSVARLWRPADL